MLLGCQVPGNEDIVTARTDTVKKELIIPYAAGIALNKASQPLFLQTFARLMQLPDITTGNSALYVRIWLWDGDKKYVVNLNAADNTCYIVEWNCKTIEKLVIHRAWNNQLSKAGWNNIWEAVNKFRIAELTSGKPYKEQTHLLTEMSTVQFEIARPNSHRYYEYLQPSFYRLTDDGFGKVHAFLKYLNKELGLEVYDADEKLVVEPE